MHLGLKIAVAIVALIGASAVQVWIMREVARSQAEAAPEAFETCPPPWVFEGVDDFIWAYEGPDGELWEETCRRDESGAWKCRRTDITGVIDYEN